MTVGEEAAADGGAVLGGLAVAVEEVELLVVVVDRFGGLVLRSHYFWGFCLLMPLPLSAFHY